jgi:hypothetical protein
MTERGDASRSAGGTPRLRGLPVFGSAAAGLLLGHTLSYALAVPDPYHRDLVLSRTGHGYLPAAGQVAVMLALAAVAAILARAWSSRDRGQPERSSRIAGTLVLLQIGAFTAQEILERVAAGAPLGDLVRDHLLVTGIVAQVAVALVGAALLSWFARASAHIVRSAIARRIALPRPIRVQALPATPDRPHGRIVASARNVRAPPACNASL